MRALVPSETALVLGGGGAKGAYEVGAIAALDEACAQLDAQVQEKTAQASEVQRELGAAQQALLQRAAQGA